jgi:hypothetical protein
MPSFKWMFRLAILLSFAWIAYGQPQPSNSSGTSTQGGPLNTINSALTKLSQLATALGDGSSTNSPSLSAITENAKSALADARRQFATTLDQNGNVNVESLLTKVSQLDQQQVVSQLQSKVRQIIQQTGSPNPESRLDANAR